MENSNIFNFSITPILEKIEIWNTELISNGQWDNLFYRGQLWDSDLEHIRCIIPCRNCYLSWFNISLSDFDKNKLEQLVADRFITIEQVREHGIAEVSEWDNKYYYQTKIGASANYVQVKCEKCQAKHLIILGIAETQPALYGGQLHGMWRIKE